MHLIPFDSRSQLFLHSFLRLQHRSINLSLFLIEFSRDGEGHSLIGHVTVPFAAHIEKDHLVGLDDFVVEFVVESGAVATAGSYEVET